MKSSLQKIQGHNKQCLRVYTRVFLKFFETFFLHTFHKMKRLVQRKQVQLSIVAMGNHQYR